MVAVSILTKTTMSSKIASDILLHKIRVDHKRARNALVQLSTIRPTNKDLH